MQSKDLSAKCTFKIEIVLLLTLRPRYFELRKCFSLKAIIKVPIMRIKESRAVLGCGVNTSSPSELVAFVTVPLTITTLMLHKKKVKLDFFSISNIQTDIKKQTIDELLAIHNFMCLSGSVIFIIYQITVIKYFNN